MIGILRQVLMCSSFSAYDGGLVFMQLTMIPCLQALGVPVVLVTVSGIMSGSLSLLGLPLLGWLSDNGINPRRRKELTVIVSIMIYLTGLGLVGAGCVVHLWGSQGNFTNSSLLMTTETAAPFSSLPSPISTENPLLVLSTLLSSQTSHYKSTTTDILVTSQKVGTSSHLSTSESPVTTTAADWQADPLGLNVPLTGILSILGYVFIDMGNDCTNSCLKGFLLSNTDKEEHFSVLVVGVIMSAVGGCVTAVLGLLDLDQLLSSYVTYPSTLVPQTLLEAAIFIAFTIFCTILSFQATPTLIPLLPLPQRDDVNSTSRNEMETEEGETEKSTFLKSVASSFVRSYMLAEAVNLSEYGPQNMERAYSSPAEDSERETEMARAHSFTSLSTGNVLTDIESSGSWEVSETPEQVPDMTEMSGTYKNLAEASGFYNQTSNRIIPNNQPSRRLSRHEAVENLTNRNQAHPADKFFISACLRSSRRSTVAHMETASLRLTDWQGRDYGTTDKQKLLADQDGEGNTGWCGKLSRSTRRLALICLSMFFMAGAWQSFNICATDYLGKVIYGGDPEADPSSQSYANYRIGLQTGSRGVLFLHIAYIVVNFMQRKLLQHICPKAEYLTVCTVQIAILLTLLFTSDVIIYYVTSGVIGVFRSMMYTIPFMMANEICQKEALAVNGKKEGPRVGSAMATVTTMIPISMITVSSLTGPLIDATGDPAFPLYYSIVCTAAAAIAFAFI